jgi:beta-aspartyl-peptidase (threonine type)
VSTALLIVLTAARFAAPDAAAETRAAIQAVLTQQADAWNKGDIAAFMEHYWKSDELTFSSGGQTTRGWQATKDNYLKRYPTREQMGQLTFSQLEITPLEPAAALVLGRWQLARESPVGGNFTLVLRKLDGRWLIVHDHTSRTETRP